MLAICLPKGEKEMSRENVTLADYLAAELVAKGLIEPYHQDATALLLINSMSIFNALNIPTEYREYGVEL